MFGKFVAWALTALFGLIGLAFMVTSFKAGICFILISILFAPPFNDFLKEKFNIALSPKLKAVAMAVLVVSSVFIINKQGNEQYEKRVAEQARETRKKQEQARLDLAKEFESDKAQILDLIQSHLDKQELNKALAVYRKYEVLKDTDLDQMAKKVKNAQYEEKKKIETKEILATLKTVPASEIRKNRNLYKTLVSYHPEDSSYKTKFERYDKLVKAEDKKARQKKEADQKERQAYIAKYGQQPEQSSWDGSYRAVEKHLKAVANDPSSIDISGCTKVYKNKTGWLVGCDFRGKNAFGALVKNSKWFTIAHGQVINVENSNAYSM